LDGGGFNLDEEEADALGGSPVPVPQRVCVMDASRDICRCGCRGGTAAAAATAIASSISATPPASSVSTVSEEMDAYSERCDLEECCFHDSAASLTEMTGADREDLRLGRRP
jgi:hypothetical protein